MASKNQSSLASILQLVAVALVTVSCRPATQTGGATDLELGNSTPPITLNAGADKPKILALHGGGDSATGFARQRGMRDLAAALPQYTFVFAHAPEPGGLWLRDPPSKSQPSTDPGWPTAPSKPSTPSSPSTARSTPSSPTPRAAP